MKTFTALLMILSLVLSLCGAHAEGNSAKQEIPQFLDLSYYEKDTAYFRIEVSEDGETASVQTVAEAQNRAFSTPYDSEQYYSTVFPELLVSNYPDETNRSYFFRIWFRYRGTQHLNIQSVSVTLDGTTYRFLDVTTEEWTATKEDGTAAQDAVIVLGRNPGNAAFFAALFAKAVGFVQDRMSDKAAPKPEAKVILHGDEDTEIDLPEDFWNETAMFAFSLDAIQGFSFLTTTTGTPCTAAENQ